MDLLKITEYVAITEVFFIKYSFKLTFVKRTVAVKLCIVTYALLYSKRVQIGDNYLFPSSYEGIFKQVLVIFNGCTMINKFFLKGLWL